MTSLSIFTPEIIDIEAQLTALQTQLEELHQDTNDLLRAKYGLPV